MVHDYVFDLTYNRFHEPVLVTAFGQLRFELGGDMHLSGPPFTCNGWGHRLIALAPEARVSLILREEPTRLSLEIRNGQPSPLEHDLARISEDIIRRLDFVSWFDQVNFYLHSSVNPEQATLWLSQHPRR